MEATHTHTYGDTQDYTGAGIPYKKNLEEAKYRTIKGTKRLIEMQRNGADIPNKDIEEGIEINATKLGITKEEYIEKLNMLLNPKPPNNPELSQGNEDYIPSESDSLNPN